MNGIIEITDKLGMDYYFADVKINHEVVEFLQHRPMSKLTTKKMALSQIKAVKISQRFGNEVLHFQHHDERFTIVDAGTGLVPMLKKQFQKHCTIE